MLLIAQNFCTLKSLYLICNQTDISTVFTINTLLVIVIVEVIPSNTINLTTARCLNSINEWLLQLSTSQIIRTEFFILLRLVYYLLIEVSTSKWILEAFKFGVLWSSKFTFYCICKCFTELLNQGIFGSTYFSICTKKLRISIVKCRKYGKILQEK